MLIGAARMTPLAAVIGGMSIKDIALYATTVTLLAGLLAIGAIWAAAKAWRERAEARTDESRQLRAELAEERIARHKQDERIAGLEAELRVRPDIRESHREILAGIKQTVDAISKNTAAVKQLAAKPGS